MCSERAPPWPPPLRHEPRVGLHEPEALDRQAREDPRRFAESSSHGLGHWIACRERAPPGRRLEAHAGGLARLAARGFEIAGDPKAAQLAAPLGLGAPRREARVIGERQPLLEIFGELPFLDLHAERRAIGNALDDVAAAKLRRRLVPVSRAARSIKPLDDVVRLGLAGAAIGIDRHRVGEDAAHIHEDRGNVVNASLRGRGRIGGRPRPGRRDIGAHIGEGRDIEREETPLGVERETRARDVVAPLRRGEEILVAVRDPFHLAAKPARREQHQHPFGIEEVLGAEATADIGRDEVDALGRHDGTRPARAGRGCRAPPAR